MQHAAARWLTAIPLPYAEDGGFWDRDAGLACLGLRELGVDAKFVALGTPRETEQPPLIVATLDQMCDPNWWRSRQVEVVFIYSWGAPRYEPIARAIRGAGIKLVVHLDSDGCLSPRVSLREHLIHSFIDFREVHSPWVAGIKALTKSLLFWVWPGAYDLRMQEHVGHADLITTTSPVACARLAKLFLLFRRPDLVARLRQISSPVLTDCQYSNAHPKQRQIVAVGRWQTYVKDAPRLVAVLKATLPVAKDYRAVIVGSGAEVVRQLVRRHAPEIEPFVSVPGYVPHAEMVPIYQQSQIILVPSRSESFHLASAEALCCGSSVVGPACIASMHWFVSAASGSLAIRRNTNGMAAALLEEIEKWRAGKRDPRAISAEWRQRVTAPAVALAVMREVEKIQRP
jgi:glycosyltransferase involved in cell wall biosynthesis